MTYSIENAVDDGQWLFDEFEAYNFWGKVYFLGGTDYEDDPLVDLGKVSGQCWEWRGANDAGSAGAYGSYTYGGKKQRAHRLAYKDFGNKLPDDLVVDHLCRNTLCVNPAHLEPTTHRENVQRGSNLFANRTHCRNGHQLTSENVRHTGKSFRCKACVRESYLRNRSKSALAVGV